MTWNLKLCSETSFNTKMHGWYERFSWLVDYACLSKVKVFDLSKVKSLFKRVDILKFQTRPQRLLVNRCIWRSFALNSKCVGFATLNRRSCVCVCVCVCASVCFLSGLQGESHHSDAIPLSLDPCSLGDVHLFRDLFFVRLRKASWEQWKEGSVRISSSKMHRSFQYYRWLV